MNIDWKNDPNIVRVQVIPVRLRTPTREPIELVVIQRQDDRGNILIPTTLVFGDIPTHIESFRFALDYGAAWIVAGFFMISWTDYVKGKR